MAFCNQRLRKLKSTTRLLRTVCWPGHHDGKTHYLSCPSEITALELADVEIDSVFGDVQAVSNLVDRIFNIEDPFLVEIQHDLTIFWRY